YRQHATSTNRRQRFQRSFEIRRANIPCERRRCISIVCRGKGAATHSAKGKIFELLVEETVDLCRPYPPRNTQRRKIGGGYGRSLRSLRSNLTLGTLRPLVTLLYRVLAVN